MRKVHLLFVGVLLLFILAACSNEKDDIKEVNGEFSDLINPAETEFSKVQTLVNDYMTQSISEEEFETEKASLIGFFNDLQSDLDQIDEPSSERGEEYYELSYDVVEEMISLSKEMLELPDPENYDEVMAFQEELMEGLEELEEAIDELTNLQAELEEEDEEYKEIFNE